MLCLYALVLLAGICGGSARGDVASLMLLRPAALLALAYALWTLRPEALAGYRWPLAIAAGAVALVVLQLVPLPPVLWQQLPGREILVAIDTAMGTPAPWRPLTMAPTATWNSLWALAPPLAVLLLGVQVDRETRQNLATLWLAIGVVSAGIGYMQAVAPDADGPLYFYEVTNRGAAVGLLANRNHQAILLACVFPLLAVFASRRKGGERARRARRYGALAMGLVLTPLILVTGSRAGLLVGVLGLASIPWLYRWSREPVSSGAGSQISRHARRMVIGGALVSLAATVAALSLSRAAAIERWLDPRGFDRELRRPIWEATWEAAQGYFPFGSGIGSFQQVFAIHEPATLLSATYRNQAHNDWLDLMMTGGLPAMLLLGAGLIFYARAALMAIRLSPLQYGQAAARHTCLGVVITAMLMLGSLADYPLRVPSLACLLATAVLWMPLPSRSSADREDHNQTPQQEN